MKRRKSGGVAREFPKKCLQASRAVLTRKCFLILARLHEVIHTASKHLDAYRIPEAARAIESLVDDLSRWYIRRSRVRFSDMALDADRAAASATLAEVLQHLARLIAPFSPFFAEALYQSVVGNKESVHLAEWPGVQKKLLNQQLLLDMAETRRIASEALRVRAELGVKVRQPLATLKVKSDKLTEENKKDLLELLKDEVNVKEIIFDPTLTEEFEFDARITPELKTEGMLRDVIREIQQLRQKAGLVRRDSIEVSFAGPPELRLALESGEVVFKKAVGAKRLVLLGDKPNSFKHAVTEADIKIDGAAVWIAIRKA